MMHITKGQAVMALGVIALLSVAMPASAQGRVPPPPRPTQRDTVGAPPREVRVAPAAVTARVSAVQQRAVPVEPLRQLVRATAPLVPAASVVPVDSVPATPPAIERASPPAAMAALAASPAAAVRSVQQATSAMPAGATGRCKDGSYLTSAASESACSSRGGLAVMFPPPRVAPVVRP